MQYIIPIIVGGFMTWLFIYLFTANSRLQSKIQAQPVTNCTGTVTEKYITVVNLYKSSKSVPHFAFETIDGQRLAVQLKNDQYAQIHEGDNGILSYRQYNGVNYFENFKLDIKERTI